MRKRINNAADFGRVAVLMGGWVSGFASRALLVEAANARPLTAGQGLGRVTAVAPWMAAAEATHA